MNSERKRVLVQIGLFIITFFTTTLAGAEWCFGKSIFLTDFTSADFVDGMYFSVPLLLVLTVHEFGHYFMAMYHRIRTSLPYYIPIPPIPGFPFFSIGTLGAVIRLRERPHSNVQNFDIGLAGPLAGFIIAIAFLVYGFSTLPEPEYVFKFHPEYAKFGLNYADHVYSEEYIKGEQAVIDLSIGKTLIFWIAEQFVSDPARVPNGHELMHYPVLMAVYFALFFTSLNLLPIGQLDGGHVVYGLFGFQRHKQIATAFFVGIMFYAGLGNPYIQLTLPLGELLFNTSLYVLFLYFAFTGLRLKKKRDTLMYVLLIVATQFLLMVVLPDLHGYFGWMLLGFLLGRFIGVEHPPSEIEQPLDQKRIALGWLTLLIFALCFTPAPFQIEVFLGTK